MLSLDARDTARSADHSNGRRLGAQEYEEGNLCGYELRPGQQSRSQAGADRRPRSRSLDELESAIDKAAQAPRPVLIHPNQEARLVGRRFVVREWQRVEVLGHSLSALFRIHRREALGHRSPDIPTHAVILAFCPLAARCVGFQPSHQAPRHAALPLPSLALPSSMQPPSRAVPSLFTLHFPPLTPLPCGLELHRSHTRWFLGNGVAPAGAAWATRDAA
jgi:hypothetical protein